MVHNGHTYVLDGSKDVVGWQNAELGQMAIALDELVALLLRLRCILRQWSSLEIVSSRRWFGEACIGGHTLDEVVLSASWVSVVLSSFKVTMGLLS